MLELRPNCECCDRDLPADSQEARICSFECTFCVDCAEQKLLGLCQTAVENSSDAQFGRLSSGINTLLPRTASSRSTVAKELANLVFPESGSRKFPSFQSPQ